jgi:hypothetical protein
VGIAPAGARRSPSPEDQRLATEEEVEMKRVKRVAAVVIVMSAMGATMAVAGSHRRPRCHEVDATFTSELVPCASPLGCASGVIRHDPLIKGAMFVTLTAAADLPDMEPASPAVKSVTTERSLSPRQGGTLSVNGFGVFDTAAGFLTGDFTGALFSEVNFITGGTGRFEYATGTLYQFGWATGPTTFAGEIHGTVCPQ